MTKPKEQDPELVAKYLRLRTLYWPELSPPTKRGISLGLPRRSPRIDGETAYIPLSKGYEAIVDAADIALVDGLNWCAQISLSGLVYAVSGGGNGIRQIRMHRIILGLNDDELEGDHQDGSTLNNKRNNLRVCTRAQNAMNRGLFQSSTTGAKGVTWVRDHGGKYRAQIMVDGVHRYLGYFDTINEASGAYQAAASEAFGEFARIDWDNGERVHKAAGHK